MTYSPDHLFHRLHAAFIRGAKFASLQPSHTPSELDKAAEEYAESIVAPLALPPAASDAVKQAPIKVRPFEWDRHRTRSECLCLTGFYSVILQHGAWEVEHTRTGDDHADFAGRFPDRETAERKAQDRHAGIIRDLLVDPTSFFAGWRSHDGSGDPDVPGDTLVEVCFRDGDTAFGVVFDWDHNWEWADSEAGRKAPGAIIAWRPHGSALMSPYDKCSHCAGTGDVSEKGRIEECLSCKGTGRKNPARRFYAEGTAVRFADGRPCCVTSHAIHTGANADPAIGHAENSWDNPEGMATIIAEALNHYFEKKNSP